MRRGEGWRGRNLRDSAARAPYPRGMAGRPEGFAFEQRGEDVVVTHHGRPATVLRGRRAAEFLEDVERTDPQEVMARVTGNYRRGNERQARQHPRNRGR